MWRVARRQRARGGSGAAGPRAALGSVWIAGGGERTWFLRGPGIGRRRIERQACGRGGARDSPLDLEGRVDHARAGERSNQHRPDDTADRHRPAYDQRCTLGLRRQIIGCEILGVEVIGPAADDLRRLRFPLWKPIGCQKCLRTLGTDDGHIRPGSIRDGDVRLALGAGDGSHGTLGAVYGTTDDYTRERGWGEERGV